MNSPHSERGRRTFRAEVITDAKEEAPTEHPEGTLLGMAREYGVYAGMAEEPGKVN